MKKEAGKFASVKKLNYLCNVILNTIFYLKRTNAY